MELLNRERFNYRTNLKTHHETAKIPTRMQPMILNQIGAVLVPKRTVNEPISARQSDTIGAKPPTPGLNAP